jgi:hypothetical protein
LLGVSVSDIHGYPLKPEGFEEPLFATAASKRSVMDHLLGSPWLRQASGLRRGTGEAAHATREPIELRRFNGQLEIVRPHTLRRRCFWKRRRVLKVLDSWREVKGWWDGDSTTDRTLFRVLHSGGAVIDISKERSRGWFLVGMVD